MAKPRLDCSAVRSLLEGQLGCPIGELQEIASGEWSQAFSFSAQDQPRIVRFATLQDDFLLDRFAARFAGPALPVPELMEMGEAFGGYYAISQRHFGEFLEGGSEAAMRRKLPSLFETLKAMREIDTSATSGFGAWRPDGSGSYPSWRDTLLDVVNDRPGTRIHGWRAAVAARPGAESVLLEGYARLEELAPHFPELRHVIHSDLIHQNVLVQGDRISAVFDWGCAMYGDFLYDLAWLTFWSPWHPELRNIDLRRHALQHYRADRLEVPSFESRLRACELHIGLAAQAYNAITQRWDELARSGRRTLQCAAARAS